MRKFQTEMMDADGIPPMSTEDVRRVARGCASGEALFCNDCPLRPVEDCSGTLISLLLLVIDARDVERRALLRAAAAREDLCDACTHASKRELRPCDANVSVGYPCGEGDPRCGSCACSGCRDCSAFEYDS